MKIKFTPSVLVALSCLFVQGCGGAKEDDRSAPAINADAEPARPAQPPEGRDTRDPRYPPGGLQDPGTSTDQKVDDTAPGEGADDSETNGTDTGKAEDPDSPALPAAFKWKTLLMTGDDSITAFDNARKSMKQQFMAMGVQEADMIEMSRMASQQTGAVMPTSRVNIETALRTLKPGADEGCLIHMTSHGSRQGFYLRGQSTLTPEIFGQILDETCGDKPTVILISACYSGVFINNPKMARKNRIILTAARADKTSFGCSAENKYTYWDSCLIEKFPHVTNWRELQDDLIECINSKETGSGYSQSLPQGFFGTDVEMMNVNGK